ncbi:hypothetical protein Adu01nite_02470 [Paractinoplanes durhamensis]|uniref:Uncharacterized protein n=1 Tax=Paractinoplanes durhamensis TaxID=113563 RepID=A0ABQ3YMT6_9ACTN|nr:hypothetical protein Adu01nite_02470 [Actinoplanes durhamensis]
MVPPKPRPYPPPPTPSTADHRLLPTYSEYLATIPFPTYCGFAAMRAFPGETPPPPEQPVPQIPTPGAVAVPAGRQGARGGPGTGLSPGERSGAAPETSSSRTTAPEDTKTGERAVRIGTRGSRTDPDGAWRDRPPTTRARPPTTTHHPTLTRR